MIAINTKSIDEADTTVASQIWSDSAEVSFIHPLGHELVSDPVARQRFLLLLFGIFASLALVLACVGIYGVLSYLAGQRVAEIGVRMALGAGARDVVWLVLRQSLAMITAGVVIGIAGAWVAGRLMAHLVDGIQPPNPATFAIMIPILVVAALVASFVPARRASRIDPMSALRQE